MTHQEDYIMAVKRFNSFLEQKHLRKTPERFGILKQVWQMEAHFGIDELLKALEQSRFHVSRATAYNTIDLLVQCGVLRKHTFGTGESQYEAAREGHLHLICTRCGVITELPVKSQLHELIPAADLGSFRPAYSLAYIYGLCGKCADDNNFNPDN